MKEQWKPIPNFEGFYEASNLGRIRSVNRIVTNGGHAMHLKGVILKWNRNISGYPYVVLTVLAKGYSRSVHRLIATTWLPNPLNLREVDHLDGIKTNNAINNLEWVSLQENRNRAWANGHYRNQQGERIPTSKLKEIEVVEMRRLFDSGIITKQAVLSRKFRISPAVTSSILRRKSWRHI